MLSAKSGRQLRFPKDYTLNKIITRNRRILLKCVTYLHQGKSWWIYLANRICMILPFKNIRKILFWSPHFLKKNTQKWEAANAHNWICWPWFPNKDKLLLQSILVDLPLGNLSFQFMSSFIHQIHDGCIWWIYSPNIFFATRATFVLHVCSTNKIYRTNGN